MIINVNLKSDVPNVTGRYGDSVYCAENGIFYKISDVTKRPIINDNLSVTTSVQTTPPTLTSYSEVGTLRVNTSTNEIFICTNNSDTENVIWKNITQELNHNNFTNKDDNYDGGHTYLVPRLVKTTNPSPTDDTYKVGTIWINTATDTIFICIDNTTDNAIWNEYSKKHTVVSDSITMNQTAYETKVINIPSVTSDSIITFQFTGSNTESYIVTGITLHVTNVVENTSVTVSAFAPDGYNGEVTFKMILN
jgi:hypothetical protein